MQLTQHFTLEELTFSQTAARLGLDNTPTAEVLRALKYTAIGMEEVRSALNSNAILVSSGLRMPVVNSATPGSSKSSQHMKGEAVDFTCPTYGSPATIVRRLVNSDVQYDQLICEYDRWVHISFSRSPRKQVLIIDSKGTRLWT